MTSPHHISSPTLPEHVNNGATRYVSQIGVEPDGICHCDPQPDSSSLGECPRCFRLDARTARR